MAEIKNTFTQGKMNKDLDERILPNGQYRDAMNVEITTSEGSDVGTVQNILGNDTIEQFVPASGYKCVGSISDEKSNSLYWFVRGSNIHAILQYSLEEGIKPVIIDTKAGTADAVLKFPNKIITGINIVDNLLLWTDGVNEPRRINIDRCKQGNTTSASLTSSNHTKLIVQNEKVETVIKTVSNETANNTAITDVTLVDASALKVGDRFIKIRSFNVTTEKTIIAINGNVITLNAAILGSSFIAPGDKLFFRREEDITEDHITAIKKSPLKPLVYEIEPAALDAKKPLFEKIFPRFSYRYKFVDGEYSTFAPFTEVVFNSLYSTDVSGQNTYNKDNAYNIEDPYNNGMRNMIQQINLYNFIAPDMPKDVVEIDLLYKQDNSSVVYILENIKNTSNHWNSDGSSVESEYKGSFTVKSENIYAAVPENQSLRIWDALPKSATSQEITGNRVVYGNYKQGYDLISSNNNVVNPKLTAEYVQRQVSGYDQEKGGIQSLKSQRDYQVGMVYGDKYGRETPVFTNEDSSFRVGWSDASLANQIKATATNPHPHWADYYKFFVKETSGEYYNLIMDAIYTPTVEDLDEINENHVWLSFPSSDRNKIKEEDYIILKRSLKQSSQIPRENKYKVLDVKNEAPDSIKYKYLNYGEVTHNEPVDGGAAVDLNADLFQVAEKRPTSGNDYLHFSKTTWVNDSKGQGMSLTIREDVTSVQDGDLFISFARVEGTTSIQTERYKFASVRLSSGNTYLAKLERPITEEDANNIIDSSTKDFLSGVTVLIEKKVIKNLEAFSGRFFVKVAKRGEITELQDIQEAEIINKVSATSGLYWHADRVNASGEYLNNKTINSDSLHGSSNPTTDAHDQFSVGGTTDTESNWQAIIDGTPDSNFFLDNLFFAAVQPVLDDEKAYARFGGQVYNAGSPGFIGGGAGDIIYPSASGNLTIPSGYRKKSPFSNVNSNDQSMSFPSINIIKPQDPGLDGENMINSIDGLIDTTSNHMSGGIKVWRKPLITEGQQGFNTDEYSYYGDTTSRKFLHISFLAPGEDLHDGTGFPSDDNLGLFMVGTGATGNSISRHLQGIWGGGIFTNESGDKISTGVTQNKEIFMEGTSKKATAGSGIVGYNEEYRHRHINQWKPEYSGGTFNANVKRIVDRIKNAGTKFRFKVNGDTEFSETFTIKNTYVVRLYNHTPWRATYEWDEVVKSGAVTDVGTSVEAAALAMGRNYDNNNRATKAAALKDKIVDFGKANNRRVCYIIELTDDSPDINSGNFSPISTSGTFQLDSASVEDIEFIDSDFNLLDGNISQNPAIWETEPKESADLDIYYEAGQAIPTQLTMHNKELFAPTGSVVSFPEDARPFNGYDGGGSQNIITETVTMSWSDMEVFFNIGLNTAFDPGNSFIQSFEYTGLKIRFTRPDGSFTTGVVTQMGNPVGGKIKSVFVEPIAEAGLAWHNCFSFGNGIESDRIRDDFNAMKIAKGVIANSTIDRTYKEEHKQNGLIYSGIYSSTGLINSLNEFISAEKITKDLNPTFGSIQKLFQRRISLIAFCEDRVVSIVSNKDALFNADGNPQLISSTNVLGDATPFVGDYGISKNPESFSKEGYRAYFTDKQRGAVLRLSMDGLTPISDAGMKDYFRDNLEIPSELIGSYDAYKQDYNLTLVNYLPQNVIQNNLVQQGEASREFFLDQEFIVNNSFNIGTPISYTAPSNVAENSDLRTVTTLYNYDMIPAGSLQAAQTATNGVAFNTGIPSATNRVIFEFNQYDGDIAPSDYNTFSVTNNPSSILYGKTSDKRSQMGLQGYRGNDTNAVFGLNSQGEPRAQNGPTDGTADGRAKVWFRTQDLDTGLSQQAIDAGLNPTSNMTTYAEEEYKVTMELQNYDSDGSQQEITVRIHLYDQAGGPLDDSYLVDGDTYSAFSHASATSIGTPDDPTSNSHDYSTGTNLGWLTTNMIELPNFPSGSQQQIIFYLKTNMGQEGVHTDSLTDATKPIVLDSIYDFINTHISVKEQDENNSISIEKFKIEKIRKLIEAGNYTLQDIPAVPSSDIQAHTIVYQRGLITTGTTGSGGWTATKDGGAVVANFVLDQGAIDEFGNNNYPPSTTTYDVIDTDPTSSTYGNVITADGYETIDPNPNGISSYSSQNVVTTALGSPTVNDPIEYPANSGNIIGHTDNFARTGNVISIFADGDGETVQLTQDITSNPLEVNHWYELKLIGVTGMDNNTSVLVRDALDSTTFPNEAPYNNPDPRGETLPGHIGEIGGSSTSPKQVKLVQEGTDLRCIWQQKHNGSLNELKINFFRCDIDIDTIEFSDITNKQTGGTVQSWSFNNPKRYHFYSPRNRVYMPSTAGLIRWGYDSNQNGTVDEPGYGKNNPLSEIIDDNGNYKANYALQNIDLEPTVDGYIFTFQISLANQGVGTGTFSGYITGGYEAVNPGQTYGIEFTVEQGGRYRIEGNLDGVTTPTITRVEADYVTPAGSNNTETVAIKTFPGDGHADKLLFAPIDGGHFAGNLLECSVKDATNYFTPGVIDSWVIEGFDPTIDNFVTFDDVNENILFTNAPDTVSIQQAISTNFPLNAIVQLKFDVENYSGSGEISGYYYNQNGEGFTFGPINNNTNFDTESNPANRVTIGDSIATGGEILNALVIFVENGTSFSATLDNFELYRIYPDFKPSTITYSEDVKGWTSFKSFVPEVGVNLSSKYYTFKNAKLYKHYFEGVDYNTFYGEHVESSITTVLNQQPDTIKIFNALSYEGTQSKINQYTIDPDTGLTNASIYNLTNKDGWYADSIITDKQSGSIKEFIEKEGKWFNYIKGAEPLGTQLPSTAELSFQGLGTVMKTESIN